MTMAMILIGISLRADDKSEVVAKMNNQAGTEVEGYALSLKAEKKNYSPGEMIDLIVTLKNVAWIQVVSATVSVA